MEELLLKLQDQLEDVASQAAIDQTVEAEYQSLNGSVKQFNRRLYTLIKAMEREQLHVKQRPAPTTTQNGAPTIPDTNDGAVTKESVSPAEGNSLSGITINQPANSFSQAAGAPPEATDPALLSLGLHKRSVAADHSSALPHANDAQDDFMDTRDQVKFAKSMEREQLKHQQVSERLAVLAGHLKLSTLETSRLLATDKQVVQDAAWHLDANMERMSAEKDRLQKFNSTSKSTCLLSWILVSATLLIFVFMVLFIRLMPSR